MKSNKRKVKSPALRNETKQVKIKETVTPKSTHRKNKKKYEILKLFFPSNSKAVAFKWFCYNNPMSKSYFYKIVKELIDEKKLTPKTHAPNPTFEVTKQTLDAVSHFLGIPPSDDKIPRTSTDFSNYRVSEPRTHNILFVLPCYCPQDWWDYKIKKEGQTFDASQYNIRNIPVYFTKIKAKLQLFKRHINIRLEEVIGDDVFVNKAIALDQYTRVIEKFQKTFPLIQLFKDLMHYPRNKLNPPMMYFENGLPGHPIAVVEKELGIQHKKVEFNEGKSALFADESVGPELDVLGEDTDINTDKAYTDLIYTLTTKFGIPEAHAIQQDLQIEQTKIKKHISTMNLDLFDAIEQEAIIAREVKNTKLNLVKIFEILGLDKKVQALRYEAINKKVESLMNKKSLYSKFKSMVGK